MRYIGFIQIKSKDLYGNDVYMQIRSEWKSFNLTKSKFLNF